MAARLPSPIGAQLLMSGGLLDARTAEMYGLVTEVANLSDALRKTEDVLTRMVEMPAPALAAAKHLLAVLPTASDEEAFEIERKCVSALFRSDDTRRRITAFAERST